MKKLRLDIPPGTCFWRGYDEVGNLRTVYWDGFDGTNQLRVPNACLDIAETLGIPTTRKKTFYLPHCQFDYSNQMRVDPRVTAFLSASDNEGFLPYLQQEEELPIISYIGVKN